jgi:hypothetical protein
VAEREDPDESGLTVRGLALPRLLVGLLDSGRSALFHVVRGSVVGPGDLPWLDVEQAVNIAVNKRPGDDVAIALDYRTDPSDPRVVGSDAWTGHHETGRFQYVWREVAPSFSAFAEALGLLASGR